VAVAVTAIVILFATPITQAAIGGALPHPLLIRPEFTFGAAVGIGLPLFIVTMASQNIPGIAVMKVNGYEPKPGPLFAISGVFSLLAAPLGGHAVNLAAITAAMCAGPDAHPDPARRYWAVLVCGICYLILGPLAGAVTTAVALAPPVLIQAVAGLALVGAFSSSAMAAFQAPESREAAAITFLVTASGVSFAGISGAFWGLLAGGLMLTLQHLVKKAKA
jgi:benzoate membrane transport protein